jgi:hypothetical protein
MVHTYYHLNQKGMENHHQVCLFASKQIETMFGVKVGLQLSDFSGDSPFWSGLDITGVYQTSANGLSTQYANWHQDIHIELGGINGPNSFSVRKLTAWMDGGDKEKLVESMNQTIKDYLRENDWVAVSPDRCVVEILVE